MIDFIKRRWVPFWMVGGWLFAFVGLSIAFIPFNAIATGAAAESRFPACMQLGFWGATAVSIVAWGSFWLDEVR